MATFITRWKTDNAGVSNSNQVKIPTKIEYSYNVTVDWGDGNSDVITTWNSGLWTHTYSSAGTYDISITPNTSNGFRGWNFELQAPANTDDKLKLIDIIQFDGIPYKNIAQNMFEGFFAECTNLGTITATDAPTFPDANTYLYKMFVGCTNFNSTNMSGWDLQHVVSLQEMFEGCNNFNCDISSWNTSNVVGFGQMFDGCWAFNQDIGGWDVSNASGLFGMFDGCWEFNQNLNGWDVSNVTDMRVMFGGCTKFNQPLDSWDVSNVTDMTLMFNGCEVFNQNINNWDVSKVTNMSTMFGSCNKFNQPLSGWTVSACTNMSSMFAYCYEFNQPLNNWDTGNVTNMAGMFKNANAFNQPLNNWDTGNVLHVGEMFQNANAFNQNISNWNTSKVYVFSYMFNSADVYNQPVDGWDTSAAQFMVGVFAGCPAFNQSLATFDISNLANANCLAYFADSSTLSIENYDATLASWAAQTTSFAFNNVDFGNSQYCDIASHDILDITKGWTLIDGGLSSLCIPIPPSFCETAPYTISASTCGNADGKITIINPVGCTYFDYYDFTLTDIDGNSYTFNTTTGEATGLTSNYYFLTATVKPAYWYYYGRETCTFEWIKIEDSDNTSYLNRVVVTPLQCQPFDVQYGRIYYEVSGLTSGNTFSFDAYTSDLSVYYSATGITSTQGFILRNAEAQCYWVRIKDEVGGCTLLLDNRCVNSIPLFSLSGIKKLWIAKWSDDLDYNYWSTADDDYFLEFEDTSFFTSTKIKEFLSLTGGTTGVTWYSLPVAGKVATLGQKLNKVPQGYIFEDTLSFAISKADADKWTKMATIINPENKWIYVVQCGNGFYWCGGYRHGGRITAYNFDIGAREADNGYKLTISCQSENKLLTNLDENYVINYIL